MKIMIKKHLRILLLTSILILFPMIIGIFIWDKLPEMIATHWNMSGNVDGWASKPIVVFGIPLLMLMIQWIGFIMTMNNTNMNNKVMYLVLYIVPMISWLLTIVIYGSALGYDVNVGKIVSIVLGCMFTIIGNYLPKQTQNYFVGIRLPWTLKSEENWRKTHHLSGWIWMISGVLIILSGIFEIYWICFLCFTLMVILPIGYSYWLSKKE
jgi:uncharacterized membrane protein